MTKSKKVWLGILTFLPILFIAAYFILFFVFFFSIFTNQESLHSFENNPDQFPVVFMSTFGIVFILLLLGSLLSIGLLIYYIIHAHNNPENDSNKKLMWTLVLIFTSSIGSVVYYFVEIIPKKKRKTI